MRTIRVMDIQPGDCYDQAIFLPSGQKLIGPGTVVTKRIVDILRRQSAVDVYLADTPEQVAEFRRRQAEGRPVEQEPVDESEQQRDSLRKRVVSAANDAVKALKEATADLPLRVPPEEMEVWDVHTPDGETWPSEAELMAYRAELVDNVRWLYHQLETGQSVEPRDFLNIVSRLYGDLLNHRQRFTQLALLCPRREDYLPDHALCVTVLALATAAQLRWSEPIVKLTGLAALTADVGMLLIPSRIKTGGEQLSDIDRGRVQRHPTLSVALLDLVQDMPPLVKLAAYQHHERANGTGYPEGQRGDNICDVAHVLAVADVFAALTSPRSYRKNSLPYAAMEQMIRNAASDQFDKPACRALCQAAGLFPVGSYVLLSNGRTARIIAANANHLDRPVVQCLNEQGAPLGPPLDLGRMPVDAIKVQRATAAPSGSVAPVGDGMATV